MILAELEALELVAKLLSRTRNYPQTSEGVVDFARALVRVVDLLDIEGQAIVQRCADISEFCPTDSDLMTVARDIKEERRREKEAASPRQVLEWRKQYGKPEPFPVGNPEWYDDAKAVIARRDELWSKLKQKYPQAGRRKDKDWPDWHVLSKDARELGYPEIADAWEKAVKW